MRESFEAKSARKSTTIPVFHAIMLELMLTELCVILNDLASVSHWHSSHQRHIARKKNLINFV